MKHAIAWLALMSLISPALAFPFPSTNDAYQDAKQEWRNDWRDTKESWKEADKPDPRPTKPARPNKDDF